MLLAGFVFLYFMGAIRSVLGSAESPVRGSGQLARVVFGGALTGMAGMAMASVTLAAASTNGADVNPVVSKAVATAAGGPFLLAAMGFAAFLMAAGLLTLRTGVLARWTGIVALIGAVCFLITFLTVDRRDDRRQPIWLRVLPSHRVTRHLDSRDEHRQVPRTGDLVAFMRSQAVPPMELGDSNW